MQPATNPGVTVFDLVIEMGMVAKAVSLLVDSTAFISTKSTTTWHLLGVVKKYPGRPSKLLDDQSISRNGRRRFSSRQEMHYASNSKAFGSHCPDCTSTWLIDKFASGGGFANQTAERINECSG